MTTILKSGSTSVTIYTDLFNKRVRVDDYTGPTEEILQLLDHSTPPWAEKIIIKSREKEVSFFLSKGFVKEATVKGYFSGADMHFLVSYPRMERGQNDKLKKEKEVVEAILNQGFRKSATDTSVVELAKDEDAEDLANLYAEVFQVYPTPLNNVDYVRKTMKEGTRYVLIRDDNKIISAASAEINTIYANAELTDCATLPSAQGKGHIKKLLVKLEELLVENNIHCLYTIARAESYGMNRAFHQLGYTFGGTLVNNCIIYSGLEDMNVWFKMVEK